VPSAENVLRNAISGAIGVVPDRMEPFIDPQFRAGREEIGELDDTPLSELVRPRARGAHGKNFSGDIDEPSKQHLLAFQLRTESSHRMKQGACEATRVTLCTRQVFAQASITSSAGWLSVDETEPLPGIPSAVEGA
jgi:hypothetical protein